MKNCFVLIAAIIVASACSFAQTNFSAPPPEAFYFQQNSSSDASGPNLVFRKEKLGDHKFSTFFAVADDSKPVTGAPYTATATTESTQVLSDGNRIVNKTSAFLARDGQGRTRREETMDAAGSEDSAPHIAVIHDPVAKTTTVLDLNRQTGHVIQMFTGSGAGMHMEGFTSGHGGKQLFVTSDSGPDSAAVGKLPPLPPPGALHVEKNLEQNLMITDGPEAGIEQKIWVLNSSNDTSQTKTESLGTQTIEGVIAEGKRTTRTIPAGQIGNERPIEITSEVWTSPDLHAIVLSKHNDPRFGETVYRLTNIQRGEPDRSLFTVPDNFTVKESPRHKGEL